jgi:hypothetical protein
LRIQQAVTGFLVRQGDAHGADVISTGAGIDNAQPDIGQGAGIVKAVDHLI